MASTISSWVASVCPAAGITPFEASHLIVSMPPSISGANVTILRFPPEASITSAISSMSGGRTWSVFWAPHISGLMYGPSMWIPRGVAPLTPPLIPLPMASATSMVRSWGAVWVVGR